MPILNTHSMRQWVRFISLQCCSFVENVMCSQRPLSTANLLVNVYQVSFVIGTDSLQGLLYFSVSLFVQILKEGFII